MIVYPDGVDNVGTNGVLYSKPEAVRKLAIMMMVNAAESNIDMIADYPEEYGNKADIEAVFANINEQCLDMLEDHIADLRRNLESFLRNARVQIRVSRLDYSIVSGKLSDISVNVDVE